MRYCVLGGAGHIGVKMVEELSRIKPESELVIADKNVEKGKEVAGELGENVSVQSVDAENQESLIEVMGESDVVVSALGPFHKFGYEALEAAIEAETDFVDINDDYDATQRCLELDGKAKDVGITAIVGLGATPGLTNIWAKYGAENMDSVEEIHTSWAWTAIDPDMGKGITDHYFHAITGMIPTYRDGEIEEVPALSEPKIVHFPQPLGEFEPANAGHPEPITIPRYIEGVDTVTNKGIVWPSSLNEAAKLFSELGLTSQKKIKIKGVDTTVRDIIVEIVQGIEEIAPEETIVEAMTEIEKYGDHAMKGVGLKTEVIGQMDGEEVRLSYASSCSDARVATALPAVIGSALIGNNEYKIDGVFPPEGIIDPEPFLEEVSEKIEIVQEEEEKLKF